MGTITGATGRLDVWRDLIREHFVALDIDADSRDEFAGAVRSTQLGHLKVASVSSTTGRYRRTPGLARRDADRYLQVGLLARGEAMLSQDGRLAELRPGDFAVYETERPFLWGLRGDWQLFVFTWPRTAIALEPGESRRLTARALVGDVGLSAIVGRLLRDLVASPPSLSPCGGIRLADEVGQLVTTVASEFAGPRPPSNASRDQMARIGAYIAEHLADPDLGPTDIARAHFMSTRQLHRLFAAHSDTVTRYVRRRRLERCRQDLATTRTPIAEVGRRWGFTDPTIFSRAFRGKYHTTPSDYRHQHSADQDD
jgi:AraC-like DNA-binding protein